MAPISRIHRIKSGIIPLVMVLLIHADVPAQEIKTIRLKVRDSIQISCKLIEPGKFLMGPSPSDPFRVPNDKPQKLVEISKAFYMALTPVTIEQFRSFIDETGYKTTAETDGIGANGYNEEKNKFEGLFPIYTWKHPGWIQSAKEPVVNVSMADANRFCAWLSEKTGKTVRLPEDEEWEYACRAGTNTLFFTGDNAGSLIGYANVADDTFRKRLDTAALSKSDRSFPFSDGYLFTAPVGSFKPNPWGLFDMCGNVWQICSGMYDSDDPGRKYNSIARGGGYNTGPEFLRPAFRGSIMSTSKYSYIGFRVAVTP